MIRVILMIIFLMFNTIWDIKIRRLPLVLILCFGAIGMIVNLILPKYSFVELLLGMAIGGGLIIISHLTVGHIGEGDGLLFVVTGLFMGGINNIQLLLWSSILCAIVAGVLFITRQVGKKDKIPFVPFVLFAYIGQVFL